nr:BREX-2 system phosphatase PglZ [Planctomycetota bacterium]
MTDGLTPTFNQIKAQVAAIRKKDPDARFIGIHARGRWEGNEFCQDNDVTYRIVQCDAPLQLRMVLQEPSEDVTATVVITPLADNQLCDDTRVRLAMRRLHPMDRWQIIKLIFSARYIDPRIIEHVFMADLLMDLCPTQGYTPVPSGTLDAETAWEILFTRYLKMSTGVPDLTALLKWSCLPDAIALWQSADDPFRNAASAWIHQTAGAASKAILNCVSKHRQPMALPVGLALGVLYEKSLKGKLDKAVGRIEQLTGNTEIEPYIAKQWYAAAVDVVRHGFSESKSWLEQSDAILQSVGAEAFAHISDVSPLGFEQRLTQFGKALSISISQKTIFLPDEVLKAQERIFSHDSAQRQASHCIERVTMAARLLRWLEKASQEKIADYGSFGEAAKAYTADGGFVDWARHTIRGGEPVKALSQAYNKLVTAVTHIREKQNKAFAELLRDWTQAGSIGTSVRCIENVIEEIIAPLADQLPVLMLLIDGMSCAVFRELLEDITAQDWAELSPAEGSSLPAVIATIPSWTKLSRTSLFCGMLQEGDSRDELKGFANHAALRNFKGSKTAPLLFHKIDVTDATDDSLAEGLREKIASKSHRVVAVVNNAVDDHLLKGDQTNPKWTTDYIRALPALLHEAKLAGRIVVMLSDHGHMLEIGTTL